MADKTRKRNHIYPAGALRLWERDGRVALRLGDEADARSVSVKDAAVRCGFYLTTLPDGTQVDVVERRIAAIETPALALIHALDQIWPPDTSQKAQIAALFGLQHLRGPAWMDWYDEQTDENFARRSEEDLFSDGGVLLPPMVVRPMREAVHDHVKTDALRLERMLALIPKVASLFACMTWVLMDFEQPMLATSDQPVVIWPLDDLFRDPGTPNAQGLIDTLEVRVPLGPRRALVMIWHQGPDVRVVGSADQAARLNAFTIASADRQWFHLPGAEISQIPGRQGPVSMTIAGLGYDGAMAKRSTERRELSDWVQPYLGSDDMREVRAVASRPVADP